MSTDDTTPTLDRPTSEVTVTVNDEPVTREVEHRLKLSDFLRYEADCQGVRVGCEHGVCGACTVLVDGQAVKSCLGYAVQFEDREIETVEGLAEDGSLHPIQRAFHEEHALQCGFCTSGFVMATKELLDHESDPDREDVERGLADNICRCTGYQNIYAAVERAADELDETDGADVADGADGTSGTDGDASAGDSGGTTGGND